MCIGPGPRRPHLQFGLPFDWQTSRPAASRGEIPVSIGDSSHPHAGPVSSICDLPRTHRQIATIFYITFDCDPCQWPTFACGLQSWLTQEGGEWQSQEPCKRRSSRNSAGR